MMKLLMVFLSINNRSVICMSQSDVSGMGWKCWLVNGELAELPIHTKTITHAAGSDIHAFTSNINNS